MPSGVLLIMQESAGNNTRGAISMSTNWNMIKPNSLRTGFMKGQPNKENCVAICHHRQHKGALSKDMMKQHECLRKQCKYLEKCYEHPYWSNRQSKNDQKRTNRQRNVQGVSNKIRTGSNVNSRSSSLNTDLRKLLDQFNEMEIFYTYIFYRDDTSKIRFLGGYYEKNAAMSMAKKVSDHEGGEYVLIAKEEGAPIGFRVEPTIRTLIEIDLTWSEDYMALSDIVTRDVLLKKAENQV